MKINKLILSTLLLSAPALADVAPTPNETNQTQLYTFPGFVFQRDNEWIGSDYLYNLQNDVGLAVEVLMPENEKLDVSNQKIIDIVTKAFEANKLTARLNPAAGMSALPFFYVQVMIFPTDQGNVTLVTGSLFENITLTRIPVQKDTALQGITWEKKTMFMSTPENFQADLTKTVGEIAGTFGERWRLFESMKPKTGSGTRPIAPQRPINKILPKPANPAQPQGAAPLPTQPTNSMKPGGAFTTPSTQGGRN